MGYDYVSLRSIHTRDIELLLKPFQTRLLTITICPKMTASALLKLFTVWHGFNIQMVHVYVRMKIEKHSSIAVCKLKRIEIWLSPMTKALTPTENLKKKKQSENTKVTKISIARIRTDLRRSVWVTTVTQIVWWTGLFDPDLPSIYKSCVC